MFISNIKKLNEIKDLSENIKKAVLVLSQIEDDIKNGRYEVDGNKIFYMVSEYETNTDNLKMEAHKKYIDIQYIIKGEEYVYVADIENLQINTPYTQDIIFYDIPNEYKKIKLQAGDYVVLYPQDAHCPGVTYDKISKVKKVVVKIAV